MNDPSLDDVIEWVDKYRTKPSYFGKILRYVTNEHPEWLIWIQENAPDVHRFISNQSIQRIVKRVPFRPNPLCCGWDYTTWEGLTDQTWTSRHLGPHSLSDSDLPSVGDIANALFKRKEENGVEIFRESKKSTLLFAYLAQWFTDGSLVADQVDRRRNFSNHPEHPDRHSATDCRGRVYAPYRLRSGTAGF